MSSQLSISKLSPAQVRNEPRPCPTNAPAATASRSKYLRLHLASPQLFSNPALALRHFIPLLNRESDLRLLVSELLTFVQLLYLHRTLKLARIIPKWLRAGVIEKMRSFLDSPIFRFATSPILPASIVPSPTRMHLHSLARELFLLVKTARPLRLRPSPPALAPNRLVLRPSAKMIPILPPCSSTCKKQRKTTTRQEVVSYASCLSGPRRS